MTTMNQAAVLAVDIGGTTIKAAIFVGNELVSEPISVPTFSATSNAYNSVVTAVETLVRQAELLRLEPRVIGVGSPGPVDSQRGVISFAPNLRWKDLPLGSDLQKQFGLPVVIDHDARTAARAEMSVRADLQDCVFIPIGTGISAAIVSRGEIIQGALGQAGELGHIQVFPGGETCSCGSAGCLEVYASASAILNRYRAAGGTRASSTADIPSLINDDPVAARIWSEAIHALATAVTTLTSLLDPEEIIIGGGLAVAGPTLLSPLQAAVESMLPWRKPPVLSLSRVGPSAGLLGAALLASSTLTKATLIKTTLTKASGEQ
ncbi:ROK family protein [Arthrobacter roseus]|uniref:ROK family protein n=1 Tax=Arthrobacter roseus TaxID=136274 RepID=UPI0019654F59|nr:ROK family protein [Arthrobacter roseus]MBM7846917.1 glucokinase [Arthrobacter roseus]